MSQTARALAQRAKPDPTTLRVIPGAVCVAVGPQLTVDVGGGVTQPAGWDAQLTPRLGPVLCVAALGQLTVLAFLSPIT